MLVVVIIVVVATIVGVLGFIFWQNFMSDKTPNTHETSNTAEPEPDPYADWNTYESINGKYTIKYPEDWIALKETAQDGPYIRNFDPQSRQPQGGYPEGYINVRVLYEENNSNFKNLTGYTTNDWYEALGKVEVQSGAVSYLPEDVKEVTVSGLPAKSAKSVFTETNEVIYLLRGETLYSINLYPYGISSDPTVKLMLDSFRLIHNE